MQVLYDFLIFNPSVSSPLLYGSVALALVSYIWAFCSQRHKLHCFWQFLILCLKGQEKEQRGAQNTYFPAFVLLLLDGCAAIIGLAWSIMVFSPRGWMRCLLVAIIWLAFRSLSVCQHFNTALISVLFVSCPQQEQGLHKVSIILTLVPFVLVILSFRFLDGIFILLDVYCLLITVAIVVSCRLPTTSSMAQQRKTFTLLAAAMFLMICFPNAVLNCLLISSNHYLPQAVIVLITNIYIMMNAGLFYLVLKIKEEDQSETLHESEVNSTGI